MKTNVTLEIGIREFDGEFFCGVGEHAAHGEFGEATERSVRRRAAGESCCDDYEAAGPYSSAAEAQAVGEKIRGDILAALDDAD